MNTNDSQREHIDPVDARRLRVGVAMINEALANIAASSPGTDVRIEDGDRRLRITLEWPALPASWIF